MKNSLKTIFILLSFSAFAQEESNIGYPILIDSVFSSHLNDFRTVNIFLPDKYSEENKYPVIYVMDGEWLFAPALAETKLLSDFEVIPQAIVVGVFHKEKNVDLLLNWRTGETTENSLQFKQFLFDELVPTIDSLYSTSGFNTLVGHSNSATFCQHVLTQENAPFRGYIALSQNLCGNQAEELQAFLDSSYLKPIFYFVASGTRDATPRLASGILLDSLFQKDSNEQVITKHLLYNADHQGIAARGLNDGISHVFSAFRHYNDWDTKLIDSLSQNEISSIDFMHQHIKHIQEVYGINFKINQDDLSLMQSLTKTEVDIEAIQEFEAAHLGKSDHFYATYAQYYEHIKSFDKALEYWEKNLEGDYPHNQHFFYFQRPIDLINDKMNDPKRAIAFATKWIEKSPDKALYLNFMIAKTAAEYRIEKQNGQMAIKECIDNFAPNDLFSLELAKQIEARLY